MSTDILNYPRLPRRPVRRSPAKAEASERRRACPPKRLREGRSSVRFSNLKFEISNPAPHRFPLIVLGPARSPAIASERRRVLLLLVIDPFPCQTSAHRAACLSPRRGRTIVAPGKRVCERHPGLITTKNISPPPTRRWLVSPKARRRRMARGRSRGRVEFALAPRGLLPLPLG